MDAGSSTLFHVDGTVDCESAVGGMAVSCRVVNTVAGGGRIEIATTLGYSPRSTLQMVGAKERGAR